MKLIPLTKGFFAKVDDEDYERLSGWSWSVTIARKGTSVPYAARSTGSKGHRKTIFMHREVLKSYAGKLDHRDGDGLNNQKVNLRPATSVQNGQNRKLQNHSTPYKGVHLVKATGRYQSYVCVNKKLKHLGLFDTAEEAALVYDFHALKYFGEFARTNQQMGAL